MKIAYISQFDPLDVNAWSGVVYSMLQSMIDSGMDINVYKNFSYRETLLEKTFSMLFGIFFIRIY
jgi:hypothetical protein